jgi:hypothetical protein
MAWILVSTLVLAYAVLAVVVARFCGVNRGWEEAVDDIPDEFPFSATPAAEIRGERPAALGSV